MSYLGKYYKFKCDQCERVVEVSQLPRTWYWLKGNGVCGDRKHACDKCHHSIPKDKKVKSGELN